MNLPTSCAIPLADAWFCQTCQVVLNRELCCYCASAAHTQRLAPWLNRDEPAITVPLSIAHLLVVPAKQVA
jgi:hypothetical protein